MIFLLIVIKLIFLFKEVYALLIRYREFFGDFILVDFVICFDYAVMIFNFIQLLMVDYNSVFGLFIILSLNSVVVIVNEIEIEN